MTPPSGPQSGGSAAQRARDKIRALLGDERGSEVISQTLRAAGLTSMDAPDERYRFGIELSKQGGLLEAIGRAIMVQALLQGAKAA